MKCQLVRNQFVKEFTHRKCVSRDTVTFQKGMRKLREEERERKNDLKWQTKESLLSKLIRVNFRVQLFVQINLENLRFFFSRQIDDSKEIRKSCTRRQIFGFRVMIKILFERILRVFMFELFCEKQIIIFYYSARTNGQIFYKFSRFSRYFHSIFRIIFYSIDFSRFPYDVS